MGKVYSEVFGVTINGNIVTHHKVRRKNVIFFIGGRDQVSLKKTLENGVDSEYDVSYPMEAADHSEFAALIHRANSENKLKNKLDTKGKNPDNDPTPPTGGTPGAAKQVGFTETFAVAA